MRRSPAYIETPQIRLPPAVNISHQNIRGVHSEHTQNFIYPILKCKWPIHTKLLAPNDLISLSYRTQYCVWNDNVYYELKKKIDWNILVLPDQCSRTFWAFSRYRYRDTIRTIQDQIQHQQDLHALENWGSQWGTSFNADKCSIITLAHQTAHVYLYQLNNQVLKHVNDYKYLGITISADLSWETYVNTTTKKLNSRRDFLRRNLKGTPKRLKQMAFITLTRSLLEYGMATWDPPLEKDIDNLEHKSTEHHLHTVITSSFSHHNFIIYKIWYVIQRILFNTLEGE